MAQAPHPGEQQTGLALMGPGRPRQLKKCSNTLGSWVNACSPWGHPSALPLTSWATPDSPVQPVT